DVGRDVLDRPVVDLVNEADVAVFPRCHARDHVAPGHLGIDHGFTSTPTIIDHHHKILHAGNHSDGSVCSQYFRKTEKSQARIPGTEMHEPTGRKTASVGLYPRICRAALPGAALHYLSRDRAPPGLAVWRERAAVLARMRSIWPRGRVTQISPIQSSLTPMIGLALKLFRLTSEGDLPRSIVFR